MDIPDYRIKKIRNSLKKIEEEVTNSSTKLYEFKSKQIEILKETKESLENNDIEKCKEDIQMLLKLWEETELA